MEISHHIEGIAEAAKKFSKAKGTNKGNTKNLVMSRQTLILAVRTFVKSYRAGDMPLSQIASKDLKRMSTLFEHKDEEVQKIGIDIVSLVSDKFEGLENEKFIQKVLKHIKANLPNTSIQSELFLAYMMVVKKLCKQIKVLDSARKREFVIGSVTEKTVKNTYFTELQEITHRLCQNLKKYTPEVAEEIKESPSGKMSIGRKAYEIYLYTLSDIVESFPTLFKKIVSKKSDTQGSLENSLVNAAKTFMFHESISRPLIGIMSKVYLMKDKRIESYSQQVTNILISIGSFYCYIRPIDVKSENEVRQNKLIYDESAFYKFLDSNEVLTVQKCMKALDLLFTLLKLTLSHGRNPALFKYSKVDLQRLMDDLEGPITQEPMRDESHHVVYYGLDTHSFNTLLPVLKIHCIQCLRITLHNGWIFEKSSWVKRCLSHILNQECIMQSPALLHEVMSLLNDSMKIYKHGVRKEMTSLLINSDYIIYPDLMTHVITMIKIILLREDKTILTVGSYSSLSAGLKVDESTQDLSPEYKNMSTLAIQTRLVHYLNFVKNFIEQGMIETMKNNEKVKLDSRLYTLVQMSHYKFSPLPLKVKTTMLEILDARTRMNSYTTHSHFLADAIINFIEMEEQTQVHPEIQKLLNQVKVTASVFAGKYERTMTDEKLKLQSNYALQWAKSNLEYLQEIANPSTDKKRDVKTNDKIEEQKEEVIERAPEPVKVPSSVKPQDPTPEEAAKPENFSWGDSQQPTEETLPSRKSKAIPSEVEADQEEEEESKEDPPPNLANKTFSDPEHENSDHSSEGEKEIEAPQEMPQIQDSDSESD